MCGRGISLLAVVALAAAAIAQDSPKKLTKAEAAGFLVSRVSPDYPPVAKQLKLEGPVEVEAVIGEDGSVIEVRIVSGNPVLTKSAAAAVKRWKFTPVTEGGKPVKAVAPVTLVFKL